MPIQIISNFVAVGKALINDEWLPVTIAGDRTKWGPEPVKCLVMLDLYNKPLWLNSLKGLSSHITQFKGQTVDGFNIGSSDFQQEIATVYNTMIKWEGIARKFVESDVEDYPIKNSKAVFSVFLPPIPLIPVNFTHHLDKISQKDGKSEYILLDTELSKVILMNSYMYLDETVGIDKASLEVQKCEINIEKHFSNLASLENLFEEIDKEVEDATLIISFICRKYVEWYASQVNIHEDTLIDNKQNTKEITLYRLTSSAYRVTQLVHDPQDSNIILQRGNLANGLFQKILKNYKQLECKHVIQQSILYILKSYQDNYIEMRLGNAYSALETLVDGFSQKNNIANSLNNKEFQKLSKKLRQIIREELGENQKATDDIIKKLPELQRRTFIDRWIELLSIYHVDLSLDWLLEHSFASALRTYETSNDVLSALNLIMKRRNNYIHQGILDSDYCNADLRLIQTLTELWIIKLLGCPDEAIDAGAFKSFSFGHSIK